MIRNLEIWREPENRTGLGWEESQWSALAVRGRGLRNFGNFEDKNAKIGLKMCILLRFLQKISHFHQDFPLNN